MAIRRSPTLTEVRQPFRDHFRDHFKIIGGSQPAKNNAVPRGVTDSLSGPSINMEG